MSRTPAKLLLSGIVFVICSLPTVAQIKTDKLFAELHEDERLVAECEQKIRAFQLSQFGRILPRINGHCEAGCPIIVPTPYYSPLARRLNITGQIKVEAIVDEEGNVTYARIIKGLPILNRFALVAAYKSRHTPKKTCDNKPIKFRWIITYNFLPN
jgi:hypothetical protein